MQNKYKSTAQERWRPTRAGKVIQSVIAILILSCSALPGCGHRLVYGKPDPTTPYAIMHAVSASFAPDGDSLLVSFNNPRYPAVYLVGSDGIVRKKMTSPPQLESDWHAVFSRDGSKIAFARSVEQRLSAIFVADADGTNAKQVTPGTTMDDGPVFSPDGTGIFFRRSSEFRSYSPHAQPHWHIQGIHWLPLDGREPMRMIGNSWFCSTPSVFPDGERVIVSIPSNGEDKDALWIAYIESGKNHVFRPKLEGLAPTLQESPRWKGNLSRDRLTHPVLSLDGRFVAFHWSVPSAGSYVCVADTTTADVRILLRSDSEAFGYPYGFSADGYRLVILQGRTHRYAEMFQGRPETDEPSDIWTVGIDGKEVRNVPIDLESLEAVERGAAQEASHEGEADAKQPHVTSPVEAQEAPREGETENKDSE